MITLTPEQQNTLSLQFQQLSKQWNEATRYHSNIQSLRNNPVYQELIALGEPIVPLILGELDRESHVCWFAVLNAITGENPVPPEDAGFVEAMARDWLDWGRRRGYTW